MRFFFNKIYRLFLDFIKNIIVPYFIKNNWAIYYWSFSLFIVFPVYFGIFYGILPNPIEIFHINQDTPSIEINQQINENIKSMIPENEKQGNIKQQQPPQHSNEDMLMKNLYKIYIFGNIVTISVYIIIRILGS